MGQKEEDLFPRVVGQLRSDQHSNVMALGANFDWKAPMDIVGSVSVTFWNLSFQVEPRTVSASMDVDVDKEVNV